MSNQKTSKRTLTAAERKVKAVQLRKEGKTFEQIAEILKLRSPSGAWNIVHRELKELARRTSSETEEMRVMETLRLQNEIAELNRTRNQAWLIIEGGYRGGVGKNAQTAEYYPPAPNEVAFRYLSVTVDCSDKIATISAQIARLWTLTEIETAVELNQNNITVINAPIPTGLADLFREQQAEALQVLNADKPE